MTAPVVNTAAKDLIKLDDISNYRGTLNSDMAATYSTVIPYAIAYIQDRLGFTLKESTYSQYITAKSSQMIVLPAYPVKVDGTTPVLTVMEAIDPLSGSTTGTAWSLLSEYSASGASGRAWLDKAWGLISPISENFPTGYGRIFISMTAGWGATYAYPKDLQIAAMVLTMLFTEERNRIGVKAKTLGPESINEYIRESADYKTLVESAIMRHSRII